MSNVTIFSTSTCAICHAEMQWLEDKGVAYTDVVVDETDEAMAQFMEATDGVFQTPPFTVIVDGKDTTHKIAGFDRSKIELALSA